MSRTDKDKPFWVRTEWYEPWHRCGWYRNRKYRKVEKTHVSEYGFKYPYTEREFIGYRWEYRGDCDLPENPVRTPNRMNRRRNLEQLCSWEAIWPNDYNMQMRGRSVKDDCHTYYHGPQRMNERLAAREAIKGDHEVEFPDGRTRHTVAWDLS